MPKSASHGDFWHRQWHHKELCVDHRREAALLAVLYRRWSEDHKIGEPQVVYEQVAQFYAKANIPIIAMRSLPFYKTNAGIRAIPLEQNQWRGFRQ